MQFQNLTIVGVGLIGGSIGLAAKKHGIAQHIHGVGRDAGKLQQAQRLGAIDGFSLDHHEGVRNANLIVYCTPVDRIPEQILAAVEHYAPGTLITDAGSTKANIVARVERALRKDVCFIGSHPLAGSEKQGVEHSTGGLFQNRLTILTPSAVSSPSALARLREFWESLGSRVVIMSPEEHDRALAMTSHLPHLVAAALAGILPSSWRELTATGFRDTTRIAAGAPEVWTPIFQQNRLALLAALEQLEQRIGTFRQALTNQDNTVIDELLAQGKQVRDALGS